LVPSEYANRRLKKIALIGSEPASLLNFRGDLISDLVRSGYCVTTISNLPSPQHKAKLHELGANHKAVPFARRGLNPFGDFITFFKLLKVLWYERPDAVLSYTIKPVIWGGLACLMLGINHVSLITGIGTSLHSKAGIKNNIVKSVVLFLYKLSLIHAKCVIFQNQDNLDYFINKRLIRSNQAIVINGSGVNINVFAYSAPNIKQYKFLCIARLLKEKGIYEYIKAAQQVKLIYPETEFQLLGGEEELGDSVPLNFIRRMHERKIITYFGEVEDVRPYIAESSVFILPSYHEGLPRSTLEAMSSGRAIITTHAPGCRDTVEEGVNGFLVEVANVEHLVEKIKYFVKNPIKITEMGAASRNIVIKRFDVKIINSQLIDAIENASCVK
jgi:glycosyltransferase involved in cell wall biosynthesis